MYHRITLYIIIRLSHSSTNIGHIIGITMDNRKPVRSVKYARVYNLSNIIYFGRRCYFFSTYNRCIIKLSLFAYFVYYHDDFLARTFGM